jgi:hypothetical protein
MEDKQASKRQYQSKIEKWTKPKTVDKDQHQNDNIYQKNDEPKTIDKDKK